MDKTETAREDIFFADKMNVRC